MQYLPKEILGEIITRVRPQRNLDALLCVSKWLSSALCQVISVNQWNEQGQGDFADTHLLTPFQKNCLRDLQECHHTTVPDVDNGVILSKALLGLLAQGDQGVVLFTMVELNDLTVSDWNLSEKVIARSYSSSVGAEKRPMYTKVEVVFAAKMLPPKEDGITRYTILLSEYTHPVDEYTPLIVYGSVISLKYKYKIRGINTASLDKAVCVNCDQPYQNLPQITLSGTVEYKTLSKYNTFFCGPGEEVSRLYSLLMQFATTPQRIILCHDKDFKYPRIPIVAKHKFRYVMELFGGDRNNVVPLVGLVKGMSYAEMCVTSVGYAFNEAENAISWVSATANKCNTLSAVTSTISGGTYVTYSTHDALHWLTISPGADLEETLEKYEVVNKRAIIYNNNSDEDLRTIIEHSLSCKAGRKGSGSLTVAEVKDLCRQRQLLLSGSREQLLRRLLENL